MAVCIAANLECPECMRYTSRNIVAICGSRDPRGFERIFNILYPAPECQPMKDAFNFSCDDDPALSLFGFAGAIGGTAVA